MRYGKEGGRGAVRNAGGTAGCIHLDNLGGQRRKQSGFGIESSLSSQREAVARDVERWRGHLRAREGGIVVRSNLGSSEMASQLLRGGGEREDCCEGDKEQRGRERERKGREQGRGMVVRVVFVEEQREGTWTKIGPVMEMREGPADNGFRGRAP